MGSKSDWPTMGHAVETLERLGVPCETRVVSAHRTAHLPGMAAAKTPLPVLGVPVQSHALNGMDSLLSIAQMPAGIPVGTLAIGKAGATNAALLAAAMLATTEPAIRDALDAYRAAQTRTVLDSPDPRPDEPTDT